jgi:hypothetical protein
MTGRSNLHQSTWRIIEGDCRASLATLEAGSVQTCVTSPPYFGLRDYGLPPSKWADGWVGCLGLEPTPDMFVGHLVEVFTAVRRVLADDGTLWVNLGDSYNNRTKVRTSSHQPAHQRLHRRQLAGARGQRRRPGVEPGRRAQGEGSTRHPVDGRVRAARRRLVPAQRHHLGEAGVMPEPSRTGPRGARVPVPAVEVAAVLLRRTRRSRRSAVSDRPSGNGVRARRAAQPDGRGQPHPWQPTEKRNKRSVWTVSTQPYAGAHFATFPPKLIEPCILAGAPKAGWCSTLSPARQRPAWSRYGTAARSSAAS